MAEIRQTQTYVESPVSKLMDEYYPKREFGPEVNLGLAASPIGPDPRLFGALEGFRSTEQLTRYRQDVVYSDTKQIMLDGLGLEGLSPKSVELNGNGSYQAGDEMTRLAAVMGYRSIMVPNYSFPNVKQWAERQRLEHQVVTTDTLDPLDAQTKMLALGRSELEKAVVYLDYPNNPYGSNDPELLREVIKHTSQSGGLPLVDLAFGEVLGPEFNRIITYTLDHGGIVLGSLSKTQGLPNLRVGYAILPPSITDAHYLGNQRMVFNANPISDFALQYLFQKQEDGSTIRAEHARTVAEYDAVANGRLYEAFANRGINVLRTNIETPIQVIQGEGQEPLHTRFLRVGIFTESLGDYKDCLPPGVAGYGSSAVRMLTPAPQELDSVINRIQYL